VNRRPSRNTNGLRTQKTEIVGVTEWPFVETEMREDDIRAAIEGFPGDLFERFARELVRRELYPGLNPTSRSHDLGEDARTEPTTVFLHNGLWVSLAISKTGTWNKLREDCLRCKETGRRIDTIVFVTADNPRTDVEETWRQNVKEEFGWDLEVRALRWLAPVTSRPEYESLVDDYLNIPPPGGDYVQAIEAELSRETNRALSQIRILIPGIPNPLPRAEIAWIEDQLQQGRHAVLTGEVGTGKSGIGSKLAQSAFEKGMTVLLLDARRVAHIRSEPELRQYLSLKGPIASAIGRVGRYKGCRLIIDQLDNVAGLTSAQVLLECALECCKLEGVEVIVISRKREAHEVKLLERLINEGFVEMTSYPLGDSTVEEILKQLGIPEPSTDLIELGSNLLNLELIGTIRQRQPEFDFSAVMEEVDLWEQYIEIVLEREEMGSTSEDAERIFAQAVQLAQAGLNSEDGTFTIGYPPSPAHNRLASWQIIVHEGGRVYRFRHESFQDFLYAWDATERRLMPKIVVEEISPYKTRNVLMWMDKLYSRQAPELHRQFLREVLDV
jgi:hypothetical protein